MKIAFIGAGRWAITLALILNKKDYQVVMWEYSSERIEILNNAKKISDLPDNVSIPSNIIVTDNIEQTIQSAEIIIFAVPAQVLRSVLIKLRPYQFTIHEKAKNYTPILVSAMKGIENNTNKRMSQVLKEFYPNHKIAVLAGPGIPYEIAQGKPASLVSVSNTIDAAYKVQELLSDENLRVYTHPDMVGAELGGALKNVIAIAAGICDGLKLGDNAKAALLTRGIAEITRLGIAVNANPMTFAGLAGIGDLIVTSYSPYSRNRILGETIANGKKIENAVNDLSGVAEGVATAISAKRLGEKMRLELPIINEVNNILFQKSEINKSVKKLMQRPLKKEQPYEVN